jgi:hypothetical protein
MAHQYGVLLIAVATASQTERKIFMGIEQVIDFVRGDGLALFLVVGACMFVVLRVWPWITTTYIPERRAHEERLYECMEHIARSLENTQIALEHFAEKCDQNMRGSP